LSIQKSVSSSSSSSVQSPSAISPSHQSVSSHSNDSTRGNVGEDDNRPLPPTIHALHEASTTLITPAKQEAANAVVHDLLSVISTDSLDSRSRQDYPDFSHAAIVSPEAECRPPPVVHDLTTVDPEIYDVTSDPRASPTTEPQMAQRTVSPMTPDSGHDNDPGDDGNSPDSAIGSTPKEKDDCTERTEDETILDPTELTTQHVVEQPGSAVSPQSLDQSSLVQWSQAARSRTMRELIRLDLSSSNTQVVTVTLDELAHRAHRSGPDRQALARHGAILTIVQVMETHLAHPPILVAGCGALEKLALDHDNEVAAGSVGGIDVVLAAMMTHFSNERVQEAAWSALWNLLGTNSTNEYSNTIDVEGGMLGLTMAMKNHLENAQIQVNASGTLANLCVNHAPRKAALAAAGGLVAMAKALQRHWDNDEVRREVSRALTTILGDEFDEWED
jgi:hypothetical protein